MPVERQTEEEKAEAGIVVVMGSLALVILVLMYGPIIYFEVAVHGGGRNEVEVAQEIDNFYVPKLPPAPDGYEWRTCGSARGVGPCLKKK